jgi:glycosyltransferase involved in cell wall biosynthesis
VHVAVTVDPYLPVPPRLYGGIERVVDILVRGLVERGHHVTLFAHPASQTPADLRPYGAPPHTTRSTRLRELAQVGAGLWRLRRKIDLVHSFGRLAALGPLLPLRRLPKIQSYQRAVPWDGVRRAVKLAGQTITFTGCSTSLYAPAIASGIAVGRWRTIFNSVDTSHYTAVPQVPSDAPLVFLGRLERNKGPHHAIAIAYRARRRLVIAGNLVAEGPDALFYHREIAPHVDGHAVQYVGPVDDEQKNTLLGRSAALLMPIEWEEPFGLVMAEALACGTPVIGFARGSVPEVIQDGMNGFVCHNVDDAVAAVRRVGSVDRTAVRADCESRFGHRVIVGQYETLYVEAVGS